MPMTAHLDECILRRSMHLTLPEETGEIAEIEAASYPADEKATPEGVALRQKEAGKFFWTLGPVNSSQVEHRVLGFVNGTCTAHKEVTEESMETHDPRGSTLIIHSVVIHPSYRRQGLAKAMLSFYLERMREIEGISRILLIAKGNLLGFYSSVNFKVLRLSPVVHGKDPWFEMALDLCEERQPLQYHVDAFTTEAFKGNPAGVVFQHFSPEKMQQIAAENLFAVTAFVKYLPAVTVEGEEGDPEFFIRWFTPLTEGAICGHATVAAVHALHERGLFQPRLARGADSQEEGLVGTIRFETTSRGTVLARVIRKSDGSVVYELSFPSSEPNESLLSATDSGHFFSALGVTAEDVLFQGRSGDDVFVELSQEAFMGLPSLSSGQIDVGLLGAMDTPRGIIVTCAAPDSHKADFLSRFFGPKIGVNEDAVCGSAHCSLAPYWCKKLDEHRLMGFQQSERGGFVGVEVKGERVLLQGRAATVMVSRIVCGLD